MKAIIAFLLVSFFASAALAQDQTHGQRPPDAPPQGWYQQQSNTGQSLSLLTFINRNTGYAGAFYTTNGGNLWQPYPQPVNVIQFIDSLHGWGASSKGGGWIAATTNGGQSWDDYNTGFDGTGRPYFCTPYRGFCFELTNGVERIARTTDGGKTWMPYPSSLGTSGVTGIGSFLVCFDSLHSILGTIDFTDPNPPYKIGAGVFYTSDGGVDWKFMMKSIQESVAYFPFAVFDSATAYFIGGPSPRVYKSGNKGYTIQPYNLPNGGFGDRDSPQGGCASNRNNITVVGTSGLIFRTYDGTTWEQQNSGTIATLNNVLFVDSTTGWIVGDGGLILHTSNAGKSWVKQQLPLPLEVRVAPEPFMTNTTLSYSIPKAAKVSVKIYDMLGKEVYHLESDGIQAQGEHSIAIPGAGLPAGVYYFILVAGEFTGMGKLTKIVP